MLPGGLVCFELFKRKKRMSRVMSLLLEGFDGEIWRCFPRRFLNLNRVTSFLIGLYGFALAFTVEWARNGGCNPN